MPPASVRNFPSSRAAAASFIAREWRFCLEMTRMREELARIELERDALQERLAAMADALALTNALRALIAQMGLEIGKLRCLNRYFRDL